MSIVHIWLILKRWYSIDTMKDHWKEGSFISMLKVKHPYWNKKMKITLQQVHAIQDSGQYECRKSFYYWF